MLHKDIERKKEYNKQYRKNNKEKAKEYQKKWYQDNKEKVKELYQDNKEQIKEYNKKYYENHKKKLKKTKKKWYQDNKEQVKQHYESNKEKIKECNKKYRRNNKEKIKEYNKQYFKSHKEQVNEYFKKRYFEDINYKILVNLRTRLNKALRNNYKSASTLELLGCAIEELKQHLEKQFGPGMSWDNYGIKSWHIDHIKPCASFNLINEEEQKECFHYTNLQPLWAKENLQKSNKIL